MKILLRIVCIVRITLPELPPIITGANLRFSGSCGIGYVFVEYGLFNATTFIQNLIYTRFGII